MTEGAVIGFKDLYDAQVKQADKLGDVAVQMAEMAAAMRGIGDRLDSGSEKMSDFEQRIRKLEAARYRIAGAATLGGALSGGGIATLLTYLLSHH